MPDGTIQIHSCYSASTNSQYMTLPEDLQELAAFATRPGPTTRSVREAIQRLRQAGMQTEVINASRVHGIPLEAITPPNLEVEEAQEPATEAMATELRSDPAPHQAQDVQQTQALAIQRLEQENQELKTMIQKLLQSLSTSTAPPLVVLVNLTSEGNPHGMETFTGVMASRVPTVDMEILLR